MSAKSKPKQYEKSANSIATIGEVQALIQANNQTQNVGLRLGIFLGAMAILLSLGAYAFAAMGR